VKKKRAFASNVFCLLFFWAGYSQDPLFSGYYATGSFLSPSLAGIGEDSRLYLGIRDQWPQLNNDFITSMVSYDFFSQRYQSGFGTYLLTDRAGSGKLDLTTFNLTYNYRIALGKQLTLRPGLKIGISNRSIHYNRLLFGDQLGYENNTPITGEELENNQITFFDSDFSLLLHNQFIWMGSTLHHMPLATQSFGSSGESMQHRLSIFGGVRFLYNHGRLLHEETQYYITFLYEQQANFRQLNTGLYWEQDPMVLGLWYRGIPFLDHSSDYNDALIIKMAFMLQPFQLGYYYDFTLSGIRSYTGGAHEISLIYRFNTPQTTSRKKRLGAVPCPRF